MSRNSNWIEFKVTWEETWRREVDVNIDEADLREWANLPAGPIPAEVAMEFLNAGEHNEWHPETTPSYPDEFQYLEIESVRNPS